MNETLGYELDVDDTLRTLHSKFDEGPKWAIKQRAFLIKEGLPDPIAVSVKKKRIAKDPIKLEQKPKRLAKG